MSDCVLTCPLCHSFRSTRRPSGTDPPGTSASHASFHEFLQVARAASVPIISALLGSAGIAAAKVTPVESLLIRTGAATPAGAPSVPAGATDKRIGSHDVVWSDPAKTSPPDMSSPGGPGLHLFWRDAVGGVVGGNASFGSTSLETPLSGREANSLNGNEEGVSRGVFLEVVTSGVSFSGPGYSAEQLKPDLRWAAHGGSSGSSGVNDLTGRSSIGFHVTQPGVTALIGLSNLIGTHLSDEIYATVLKDLQVHFGLLRSTQTEERWNFTPYSSAAFPQNRHASYRRVLLAQTRSYWEWLGVGPKKPPTGEREYNQPGSDRSPPSCSSC